MYAEIADATRYKKVSKLVVQGHLAPSAISAPGSAGGFLVLLPFGRLVSLKGQGTPGTM